MKISQANGVTRGKTLHNPHVAYAGKEARKVTLVACCLTYLLSQSCDFLLCFVVGAQALPRPLGLLSCHTGFASSCTRALDLGALRTLNVIFSLATLCWGHTRLGVRVLSRSKSLLISFNNFLLSRPHLLNF